MRKILLFILLLRLIQMAVGCHAWVAVFPSRSQFFEYEPVSISCEQFGSGGWTVWRYTTNSVDPVLSQCGSNWGHQVSSVCEVKTIKKSDNGVYWCESQQQDSSNTINITITGGQVILHGPTHPVKEGGDVTLYCTTMSPPSATLKFVFFRGDAPIGTASSGHMTIHNFSRSQEGVYRCGLVGGGESPPTWLLLEGGPAPVQLTLQPVSSQLFEYDNLTLDCGDGSGDRGWRVFRAVNGSTSHDRWSVQVCEPEWGAPTASGCILQTAKKTDSGMYWYTPVTLQSPVAPVMVGEKVTLRCRTKRPSSGLPSVFYKDDSVLLASPTDHMTIHLVSRWDEGVYRCHVSGHGDSPSSWLFVRGPHSPDPSSAGLLSVLRHLVVVSPYCISTILMVSLCLHRSTGVKESVNMMMPPPSEDDDDDVIRDHPYEDVAAGVSTEHHF
ncbi:sialoadhesin-like isoform X2 [Antennarius striatus]|uniref:sialoadhesin-like isoform X2 n=1 Tax=Antennarius striatus TaxID=241820 RepID=UPI0035AE87DF